MCAVHVRGPSVLLGNLLLFLLVSQLCIITYTFNQWITMTRIFSDILPQQIKKVAPKY